jgi:hypothetical protein
VELSAEIVTVVALVAAGGVLLLLGLVIAQQVRLSSLKKAYNAALDPSRREDLFQAVQRQAGELQTLRDDLVIVHDNTRHLRELIAGTVSKVGLIRYDAFEDMGGALSFSVALLDEHRDGVVISAINGRTETRCYAKPVRDGTSEHNLSGEETAAIGAAAEGKPGEVRDVTGTRRGRRRAS